MKPSVVISLYLVLVLPLGAAGIVAGTPEAETEIEKLAQFARELEREQQWLNPKDAGAAAELKAAIRKCGERNFSEGLPVIKKLADDGDRNALYVLGKLHAQGAGVPKSAEEARKMFEQAAENGQASALVELAILAEAAGSDEAFRLFRRAAEGGHPMAELKLGHCYETGALGVQADPVLALTYYKKAAEAGLPLAMFHLGRCYDDGIGVAPDAGEGTRWIRQAGLRGAVPAQLAMAGRYFQGKGLESDPVAAVGWLTVASQNGSTEAQLLLGSRFEEGDAVVQDYKRAGQLYTEAAQRGNPAGRERLARLYLEGKGTAKDPVRAYILLLQCGDYAPAKELRTRVEAALTPEQMTSAWAKMTEEAKGVGEE